MAEQQVLYDGWPLVYQPDSPASLHLLTLLAANPDGIEPLVALPGDAPPWFPSWAQPSVLPVPPTPRGRFTWEQRVLPGLAGRLGARLLHLTGNSAPLFGRVSRVASPTGYPETSFPNRGLAERLRVAAAAGGAARLKALFWPADLPAESTQVNTRRLPPAAYPGFLGQADYCEPLRLEVPESFVLYHGPLDDASLRRVLAAWSWVSGPLGIPSLFSSWALALPTWLRWRRHIAWISTVRLLPVLPPGSLPELYRRSAALFHPVPAAAWGDPLRAALACGRPVIALEEPRSAALAGPAAYLAPGHSDGRALGGALVTVLVEENVAESLVQAAVQRALGWQGDEFAQALGEAYTALIV